MKNDRNDIMAQTMKDCAILYCNKNLPPTKSLCCFGWECKEGWYNELKTMSCRLEALNLLYYSKYNVRIQIDQLKEKFGKLVCYYSIECDNYTKEGLKYKELIDDFESKKDNGYFGIKHVVDKKGYYSEETNDDGSIRSVWHCPETHIEITKHKDEYDELSKKSKDWYKILLENGRYELTSEQKVIIAMLDFEAEKIIDETTKICYNICEDCGHYIGDECSPRCQTTGLVSYICCGCAEKVDSYGKFKQYFKNGALYEGKKLIKTKAQIDAEIAEREAKWKEDEEDLVDCELNEENEEVNSNEDKD